jgi:Flp pilus assembly protein TadG
MSATHKQAAAPRRFWRLGLFRRNQDGATAVEFALVAPPFLAIMFAIIETGMIYFTTQVMEKAVYNAGRTIMTGAVMRTPGPPAAKIARFKTEMCGQVSWFINCGDLVYDVQAYQTFGDTDQNLPVRDGNLDMGVLPRFNPGTAGQVVVVRVYLPVQVYTSFLDNLPNLAGNKRLVYGVYAFKNEPFGTTGTGT